MRSEWAGVVRIVEYGRPVSEVAVCTRTHIGTQVRRGTHTHKSVDTSIHGGVRLIRMQRRGGAYCETRVCVAVVGGWVGPLGHGLCA